MKFRVSYLLFLLFLIILTSCNNDYYSTGTFPDEPVNMSDFNTSYDDFNMAFPTLGTISPICFSSNRDSFGDDFNIIYKILNIEFSNNTGIITINDKCVETSNSYLYNENLNNAMELINTNSDEFGPNVEFLGWHSSYGGGEMYHEFLILYSNDDSGNQDIKFTTNYNSTNYTQPQEILFLNSEFDDAYPTYDLYNKEKIYFTSNREGSFNIFYVQMNSPYNGVEYIEELASPEPKEVFKISTLCSEYDDKCPMIICYFMVFASNRPGGYGGFDLYYSLFSYGNWSEPQNFGPTINTEYDEYRPFVKILNDFSTNSCMIFSSNRPNGSGGFDLYYVGIDNWYQ